MEDIDETIIESLSKIGLEVSYRRLGEMTPHQIIEAIGMLTNVIDPGKNHPTSLPSGMSGRFKVGGQLANACKAMGCSGDLGYHTFLYPDEKEIRNIFIFLLEKLPKAVAPSDHHEEGDPLLNLKKRVGQEVARLLQHKPLETSYANECEPFCSCDKCYPEMDLRTALNLLPKETRNSAFCLGIKTRIFSSAIETNAELMVKEEMPSGDPGSELESSRKIALILNDGFGSNKRLDEKQDQNLSIGNSSEEIESKCIQVSNMSEQKRISPKSEEENSNHENPGHHAAEDDDIDEQEDKIIELKIKKDELEKELLIQKDEYKVLRSRLMKASQSLKNVQERKTNCEQQETLLQEAVTKQKKIITLLPDGEENLQKLREIVEKSKTRYKATMDQWTSHKAMLMTELKELNELSASLDKSQINRKRKNQKNFDEKVFALETEIRERDKAIKNRKKALLLLDGDSIDRLSYVKKMLDIRKNLEKQESQLDMILSDVRSAQKDINSLNGKLERTYFELNIRLKDKEKDLKDPHAVHLKTVVKDIHQKYFLAIEAYRKLGTSSREIRDLEEQVKQEDMEKYDEKVVQLEQDLLVLVSESKQLSAKLKNPSTK